MNALANKIAVLLVCISTASCRKENAVISVNIEASDFLNKEKPTIQIQSYDDNDKYPALIYFETAPGKGEDRNRVIACKIVQPPAKGEIKVVIKDKYSNSLRRIPVENVDSNKNVIFAWENCEADKYPIEVTVSIKENESGRKGQGNREKGQAGSGRGKGKRVSPCILTFL